MGKRPPFSISFCPAMGGLHLLARRCFRVRCERNHVVRYSQVHEFACRFRRQLLLGLHRPCPRISTTKSTVILLEGGCKTFLAHLQRILASCFSNPLADKSRYNERARLDGRRLLFNAAELCRITATAVDRSTSDVETFLKVAEGGSYRTIQVIFRDGLQVITRLPYPSTKPAALGTSSEVATMDFLQRHGVTIPKVHAWGSTPSNSVGAEYMIMEKVQRTELQEFGILWKLSRGWTLLAKVWS
jgi:hypothetical protein